MSSVAYWSNHRRAMGPQFSADNISPITLWLGKAGCGQEFAANLDCHKSGRKLVRDSLRHGRSEINSFPDTLPDFLEPRSWVGTVNHAPQKAQPLGYIVAVLPDVVLRDLGVQGEKGIHIPRLRAVPG